MENLAGITMLDPVFVDTSEGRAVVADSLKPQVDNELEKETDASVNTEKEKKEQMKIKPKSKKRPEEVDDESDSSCNVTQEDKQIEVKRGKCMNLMKVFCL